MSTETKERKTRAKRRNYQREMERLSNYLDIIIRVKGEDDSGEELGTVNDHIKGQLKAYRDIQGFMKEMANGVK